jgi:hypothetical protein
MKRLTLLATLMLGAAPAIAGPYAPAAGQTGSTAISKDSSSIVEWVSSYFNYQIGSGVDATFQTPLKALGPAVGDSFDIVSLGNGGSITLGFANPIADGPGFDFAVFENSFSDTFLELGWVEVSSDGVNFARFSGISFTPSPVGSFGAVDPTNIDGFGGKYRQGFGTPFDLSMLTGAPGLDVNSISFVRILDIIGDGSQFDNYPVAFGGPHPIYDPNPTSGSGGFDLDAIGVLNVAAVPLPASFWLLASGVGGLFFTRRARRVPAQS